MTDEVTWQVRDGVALISLARPPANMLDLSLRTALVRALGAAVDDPAFEAVVIRGEGANFSLGTPLQEFDGPIAEPTLRRVCALIEAAGKPVICALHGQVQAGALELALAAHARTAGRAARLSMGEIRLGLIPGAGATQRLPRLIGAEAALDLLLSGRVVTADDPIVAPLFSDLTQGDPAQAALSLARVLAQQGDVARSRDCQRGLADPQACHRAIREARRRVSSAAEAAIVDCVEAAQLLPFDRGLDFEETRFDDCRASPEARALRHLARAHQTAMAPVGPTPVQKPFEIVTIGLSEPAVRLSAVAVAAGHNLHLLERDPARCAARANQVQAAIRAMHPDLEGARLASALDRLRTGSDPGVLNDADLVLDGGETQMTSFGGVKPGMLWLSLAPGGATARVRAALPPGQVLDLHLYGTEAAVSIAEWSSAAPVDPAAFIRLQEIFRASGAVLIAAAKGPAGGLGQRMLGAYQAAGCTLVAHGLSPFAVDRAARTAGFADGPFRMIDEMGLREAVHLLTAHAAARGLAEADVALLQLLADKGRHGRRAARGVYAYTNDGPQPDPAVERTAGTVAKDQAIAAWAGAQVSVALIAALAGEAAVLLSERRALRAGDLDLLVVRAAGFAPARGGPLFQADEIGPLVLKKEMQGLSALSALWRPPELILDFVKNGTGFCRRMTGAS